MDRIPSRLAALVACLLAASCGGGSQKYPDATVSFDGSGANRDGGAPDTQLPPPMSGPGSRLVVPGSSFLVGSGTSSCTNQVPASGNGDRWCAFARQSTVPGGIDLFVIDATVAAAGTAISCDGLDANCSRLTTNLFVDSSLGVRIHAFDGDTLIYYADASTATTSATGFIGPVYAWRPGWTGGRKLTNDTGVLCVGQAKAEVAICFDHQDTTSVSGQVSYDIHAGALPTSDSAPPIPLIETVLVATNQDPSGVTKFQFDFSPDGMYAAWSARPNANGLETLKVLHIGDTAATMVAEDVTQWQVSPDGMRWYWLKTFNYSVSGNPSGTLQMAPFPTGTAPTTLALNVGDYDHAGMTGVVFRDGVTPAGASGLGTGSLRVIANRDAPTGLTTLDTGVIVVVDVAKDGTKAMYAKNLDGILGTTDLLVASASGAGSSKCTLAPMPTTATLGSFLASGGGAAWADFDGTTGEALGMFTSVPSCASAQFASNVLRWLPIADEGFLFGDDSPDGFDMTLRYSKVAGTSLPTGTSIQTRADPVFAPLLPALAAVIFTVNAGSTTADGLYINAELPFTPGSM
jgi:hypothetical protein